MATEKYSTLVHRWFDEVWNQGLEEVIDELFAEDGIAHGLSGSREPIGPQEYKPFYRNFRNAFPDIHITVEDTVSDGEKLAARCRVQGSHLGDSLGIPATGKKVDFTGTTILRIKNGKIVEAWNDFDFLKMYQQLGAIQL